MNGNYTCLSELLAQDKEAKQYFDSLPGILKAELNQRSHSVQSVQELKELTGRLMQNGW